MNRNIKLSAVAAMTAIAATWTAPAQACATCGCALSGDAATGFSASAGWRMGLRYDYINQNQLHGGSGTASPEQVVNDPTTGELEHNTLSRVLTVSVGYSPDAIWSFNFQLPYIVRTHSSYTDTTSAPFDPSQLDPANLSSSRSSSFGDAKFIVGYQGFLPRHNLGVQFGLKLPTGRYGGPDPAGGVLGRRPVTFSTGPSAGELLDTSLQPGTGSTDAILGAYYYQPVSQDFDFFVDGEFQAAIAQKLDQPDADFRPGNLAVLSVGLRYEADPKIVPQLQLNLSRKSHDQGALADGLDSAGTVVYLSPGIATTLDAHVAAYGFVQVPIYRRLDGYQLSPRWTATLGLNYAF